MAARTSSLITRLRRSFAVTAMLLAFLMLAKVVFVTVCLADGFTESAPIAAAAAEDSADTSPVPASDDDGACWHAGSTGCHCACAHGSALATDAMTVTALSPASISLPAVAPLAFSARRSTTFRPPII
jgi:hypothetical protein